MPLCEATFTITKVVLPIVQMQMDAALDLADLTMKPYLPRTLNYKESGADNALPFTVVQNS